MNIKASREKANLAQGQVGDIVGVDQPRRPLKNHRIAVSRNTRRAPIGAVIPIPIGAASSGPYPNAAPNGAGHKGDEEQGQNGNETTKKTRQSQRHSVHINFFRVDLVGNQGNALIQKV